MNTATSEAAAQGVPVDIENASYGTKVIDAAFFAGLTKGRGWNRDVRCLHMTAKLNPELPFFMEAEQNLAKIGSKDETARSHVLRTPVPIQG